MFFMAYYIDQDFVRRIGMPRIYTTLFEEKYAVRTNNFYFIISETTDISDIKC